LEESLAVVYALMKSSQIMRKGQMRLAEFGFRGHCNWVVDNRNRTRIVEEELRDCYLGVGTYHDLRKGLA